MASCYTRLAWSANSAAVMSLHVCNKDAILCKKNIVNTQREEGGSATMGPPC